MKKKKQYPQETVFTYADDKDVGVVVELDYDGSPGRVLSAFWDDGLDSPALTDEEIARFVTPQADDLVKEAAVNFVPEDDENDLHI